MRFFRDKPILEWTEKEMKEAASILAHEEIYNQDGSRDVRREKKLKSFAANDKEKWQISEIIARARIDELAKAQNDEDWDNDEPPHLETDSEVYAKNKRKTFIIPGVFLFVLVIFSAFFALKQENAYIANIKTEGRSSTFISAEASDLENKNHVMLKANENNVPDKGLIASNMEIGSKDGAKIVVKGKGVVECSIINSATGRTISENKAQNVVQCST